MEILTAFAIGLTFSVGIFQILQRNMIRSAIGLMLLANAISLFLLSAGAVDGESASYVGKAGVHCDAVPQALILTAIVISLGMSALVLAMLYVNAERYNVCDTDELDGLKR